MVHLIGSRPGEHSFWMIGRHNGGTIDAGLAQDYFRPLFGRGQQRSMRRRLRAIRRTSKTYHRGEQHDERNRESTPEHIQLPPHGGAGLFLVRRGGAPCPLPAREAMPTTSPVATDVSRAGARVL